MFRQTAIPDVLEIQPKRYGDDRGFLVETWNAARYRDGGIEADFVQDNMSFSRHRGTVRGLHFQLAPHAQAKLVSCLAGHILDVAVDLRAGSPHFGQHVALELSAEQGNQMYVPEGFAHGFCTLSDDCLVAYRLSNTYAPQAERSLAYDDPELGIDWPISRAEAHLSERDRTALSWAEISADLVS
ncbi:MAG: dTDP-4-dehydrorhamnose 3,5-epimerase [Hyphomonadaceae bacterium]|nr:dTDP-4-dehydrorhamnose 3,5-epimerase [Hyphomonadaceae bacterium]